MCSHAYGDQLPFKLVKDWLGNNITATNGNFSAHVYVFELIGYDAAQQLVNQAYIATTTSSPTSGVYQIDEDNDHCVTGTDCLTVGEEYLVIYYYGGSHTAADGLTRDYLIGHDFLTAY